LGRFPKYPIARFWWTASGVLLGGAIGGALAAFQLDPKANGLIYGIVVGAVALVGTLCFVAGLTTNSERAESIRDIKEDFDGLLNAYPSLPEDPSGGSSTT
jgi:hypothetical protein